MDTTEMQSAGEEIRYETESTPAPKEWFEKISWSYGIFLALIFLLPIFFLPASFPLQFSKTILIFLAVLLVFVLHVITALRDGRTLLPSLPFLIAGGSVIVAALLSAIFSDSARVSFVGQEFETGTFLTLLVLILLSFFISTIFDSNKKIIHAYGALLLAFCLAGIFEIVRIFYPSFLSLGVFSGNTTLLGSWSDLGVFFGFSAVLSLLTLELMNLSRVLKITLYALLVASLFIVALTNFTSLWIVIGSFSIIILVYSLFFRNGDAFSEAAGVALSETPSGEKKMPFLSLSVLLVSILCIFFSAYVGDFAFRYFNLNSLSVWPRLDPTLEIAKATLRENPLLGVGSNHFVNQWLLHKPSAVNESPFWNLDFDSGFGFLPTFAITGGIAGILSWFLFLGVLIYAGFSKVLSRSHSLLSRYISTSSLFGALFLFVVSFVYTPNIVVLALMFILTGIFFASIRYEGVGRQWTFSFADNPRKSFISVLVLVVLLIASVAFGYFASKRFAASMFFQKAVVAARQSGNVDAATLYASKASRLIKSDVFYRLLVEMDLVRMQSLLSRNIPNAELDTARVSFQSALARAIENAQAAVKYDDRNYQNWLILAQVYQSVVPLKIEGAYEGAKRAYDKAAEFNPKNPSINLSLARLEALHGDLKKAKEYVLQSLQLKSNYTDAAFFLSQIQAAEGNLKDAITSVEAAVTFSPNDNTMLFQLGFLRFINKEYQAAAAAFERALALVPFYANAKYFLGLSYEKLGRSSDALKQFTDLKISNPDNTELDLIIKNLKAGRPALKGAADEQPEKRSALPLPEKGSK